MNRAFLEALGLDKETIDSIMGEHGKSINVEKAKVTNANTSLTDLQAQLIQRDNDLKELQKKATGSEDLQTQLTNLQTQYDKEKGEFDQKLKDTQLASAIKLALAGKVHDTDIATNQLDKSLIELDAEGKVTKGLDEQLKTLQESKPFLFVPEGKQNIKGVIPATPGGNKDEGNKEGDYGKQIAEERSKGNEGLADARKSYFE